MHRKVLNFQLICFLLFFQITTNVLETISNVVQSDHKVIGLAQKQTKVLTSILKSLDEMAVKLGDIARKTNKSFQIEKPNIALVVKYSEPVNLDVLALENSNKSLTIDILPTDNEEKPDGTSRDNKRNETVNEIFFATSKVPEEAFKNESLVIYSYIFREDTFFQDEQKLEALENNETPQSSILSAVLAVTVGKEKIENLATPIVLKFKKLKKPNDPQINENEFARNLCVFWNPNAGEIKFYQILI